MRKLLLFAIIMSAAPVAFASGGTCPASVPADIKNCYYIAPASGSDSNSGTSEASPWLHAPGMAGTVTGVGPGAIDDAPGNGCPSICTLANTGFIFKGGETIPYTDLLWTIREQGSSLTAR